MNFNRPTLTELKRRQTSDLSIQVLGGDGLVLKDSPLGIMANSYAGASHLLHGHLDWVSLQVFADTAEESALLRIASMYGIEKKTPTYAAGNVTFTGVNTSVVSAGTIVQRSDGVEFTLDADATIASGSAVAAITCSTVGATGNTDESITLSLLQPVSGIDNASTVNAGGIANGTNLEDIEALRVRVLQRIRAPARGGSSADYEAWALEISGVTRAWVFPNHTGVGKVGITFVLDGEVDIIPDGAKVAEVLAYIETVRPITAKQIIVFAPTKVDVDLTISLAPNTVAVQTAVEAELTDFITRQAFPAGELLESHINEAISVALGENDHTIDSTTPAIIANKISFSTGEIGVLGTITWATL